MNDSEIKSHGDLAGRVAALQRQAFTLLLALIVVSGTLVAYLGYESYHLGKDINAMNAQVVQPYVQKLSAITNFVNQTVAYGQTHPDFRQVLVKDGVVPATPPPAAAPAKPAAAAPAVPKKQ
jgi:hypothetical protein